MNIGISVIMGILATLVDRETRIFHLCDPWLNRIIAEYSLDCKHVRP